MEDRELEAMAKANAAVKDLIEEERVRVIQWLAAKYMTNYTATVPRAAAVSNGLSLGGGTDVQDEEDESGEGIQQHGSFAELLAASISDTPVNRVLLAAYWLQVVEGADSFKTFALNKVLKDTGNFDDNINVKLRSLRSTKPAKIVQLAKTSTGGGKGHRTMKLTTHGVSEAEKLLGKTQ
ncbi:MAG TPA: hypothetical protein VFM68_01795 [Candidatus Saccharimonadales bacterium]|nr:hypothetical protein [Candidatus Saccharimonadales bacterium]